MSKRASRPRPLHVGGSSHRRALKREGADSKDEIRPKGIVSGIARPADQSLARDAIVVFLSLQTLVRGLRIAFRDLDKQHDARTMQRRYIAALMRIADFVHDTAMGDHIAVSLLKLAMAISELESGIVNPVLAPQKLKTRAPASGLIWMERVRLVCAYELLLASGLTSRAAIQRIQEYGNAFDRILERSLHRGRAALSHSLQSWRKALKSGKVASPIVRARYKTAMENVDAAKKLATPSQIGEFARDVLEAAKAATADLTVS